MSQTSEQPPQKNLQYWLDEYSETHQHPVNKKIHVVCVPLILFSTLGLVWELPLPSPLSKFQPLAWTVPFVIPPLYFYLRLSARLAAGMFVTVTAFLVCFMFYQPVAGLTLWQWCLVIFIAAWVGQFIGHHIEGKKPSFFQDLKFLLIGPLWVLHFAFGKLSRT